MTDTSLHPHLREYFNTATPEQMASGISQAEGEFLAGLITTHRVTRSMEVGCAEGISSLFICDALSRASQTPSHVIIDPYQTSQYNNVGIKRLDKAGFHFYKLLEEPSELALPRFVGEGVQVDFAFIDGRHTFDHVLLDFFYVNRMLKPGGVVAFDDAGLPSIRKVVHYVATYPCYRFLGGVRELGWRRGALNRSKQLVGLGLRPFTRVFGEAFSHEWLDGSLVNPGSIADIDYSSMVAFQKVAEDDRPWNWYRYF